MDSYVFLLLVNSFQKYEIPMDNTIGFACNGDPTTVNYNKMLQKICPGAIFIKFICHSIHTCVSEGCKKLPSICESLAQAIFAQLKIMINNKRVSEIEDLKKFHSFAEIDVYRMLRPPQTQWLSQYTIVDIILKNWDELKLFFLKYENKEIIAGLSDPIIKVYYLLLQYILRKVSKLNDYFQNEVMNITDIHDIMKLFYKEVLSGIMEPSYIESTKLDDIDPTSPLYRLHKIEISDVQSALQSNEISFSERNYFEMYSLKFFETVCMEIRKRYKFDDNVMDLVSLLRPDRCKYAIENEGPSSLIKFFKAFPRITPKDLEKQQSLNDEWKKFQRTSVSLDIFKYIEKTDIYWHKISQLKDKDGTKMFNCLPEYILSILSLPHSNAECERIFSELHNTDFKEDTETVKGYMFARQAILRQGNSCADFQPDKSMMGLLI